MPCGFLLKSKVPSCTDISNRLASCVELKTKRLTLRPIKKSDASIFFAYKSNYEANKYQPWIPQSLEDAESYIGKKPREFGQIGAWFQFVIIEQETAKLIGDFGVRFADKDQCEIGFTLSKDAQGRGFASEAAKGVLDYLFLVLKKHRVFASLDPANAASEKLLKKLGFRKEAHFKESYNLRGIWVDDIIYGLLASEWQK